MADTNSSETSQRLKSLVSKAAPTKAESAGNPHRLHSKLPQLVSIVNLLRQQQSQREQDGQRQGAASSARAIFHPIPSGRARRSREDEVDFLEKLSPFDFRAARKHLLAGYTEVRNWFFTSQQYVQWCRGRPWQLYCYGEPRSGKTTFAAAVASEVEKTTDEGTAVVTLFLQRTDPCGRRVFQIPRMCTVETVLRAILRQLVATRVALGLPSDVMETLESSRTSTINTSLADIRKYVLAEADRFDRVFLIVDGLDSIADADQDALVEELSNFLQDRVGILRLMLVQARTHWAELEALKIKCDRSDCDRTVVLYWQCPHCNDGDFHLCQSCVDEGHHCVDSKHKLLEPYKSVEVELRSPQDELVRYVHDRLEEEISTSSLVGRRLSSAQSTINNIENTIAAKAAGVFLLAKLYVDYVHKKQSLNDVLDTLDRLPQHEADYYDTLISEVLEQPNESDKLLALATLAIVSTASYEARPLTFDELAEALQHHFRRWTGGDLERPSEHTILRITKGFLTIGLSATPRVQPFHDTAGVYLYENCKPALSVVHLDMALLCCDILLKSSVDLKAHTGDVESILGYLHLHPLTAYALQYWGSHIRHNSSHGAFGAALGLMGVYESSTALMQANVLLAQDQPSSWTGGSHRLHLCARHGLTEILSYVIDSEPNVDLNTIDRWSGWTPLMIAVRHGHLDTVRRLLQAHADVSVACQSGRTTLWEAVDRGELELLQTVLERCDSRALNAHNKDQNNETALMQAMRFDNAEITRFLLRRSDLDPGTRREDGRNALHLAADLGNATVIRQLAKRGDFMRLVNATEPLLHRTTTMLLLESSSWASVESSDEKGSAAPDSRLGALQLLKQHGADFSHVDDLGRTLLHYAAMDDDFIPVMKYILKQDSDINAQDHNGWTALHCAALGGFCGVDTVQTLLEAGADRNVRNDAGLIASEIAALYHQTDVEKVLGAASIRLQKATFRDIRLWQSILLGAYECTTDELEQVSNEEVQERNPLGYTTLHCAVEAGSLAMARALLNDGRVHLSARNNAGLTALLLAIAQLGTDSPTAEEVVIVLLRRSDVVDQSDQDGAQALELAVQGDHWIAAVELVKAGAKVSLPQERAQKLFHECVRSNEPHASQRLLDAGARVLLRDSMGRLPSQMAAELQGSSELLRILHQAESSAISMLSI